MENSKQNIQIQRTVVFFSLLLFIIKIIAYGLTKSVAILSDALESIVNVVSAFIGWYSLYYAARPRDEDHPYGHGKIEFISAAIEGTLIIVAGILIIVKAISNLWLQQPLFSLDFGIGLIVFTAVVNYILGIICVQTGKKNHSLALISSGKHLQSDTISTLGIILGLLLVKITHIELLDSVIALLISTYIIFTGYKILKKSVAAIMDEADEKLLLHIVETLNKHRTENWIDVHNTRIIKYGQVLHVDAHVTMPWYFNLRETNNEVDKISDALQQKFGEQMELFVHTDSCSSFSCQICSKKNCEARQFPFQNSIPLTLDNIRTDEKHKI